MEGKITISKGKKSKKSKPTKAQKEKKKISLALKESVDRFENSNNRKEVVKIE